MTLFCPSPPAAWPAQVLSLTSAKFISLTHTHTQTHALQLDGTFANFGVYTEGLFVFLKSSAAKSAHMRSHGGDKETGRDSSVPGGPSCFCPLRRSLSGATIQTCLTINLFGRDVGQSMKHQGLGESDKSPWTCQSLAFLLLRQGDTATFFYSHAHYS